MRVSVEGADQLVELVDERLDVDQAAQLPAVDLDALRLVDDEHGQIREISGERADDDGAARLRHDEQLLLELRGGGAQADAGDLLRGELHGACVALHGADDALVDGDLAGACSRPDVADESLFRRHG